MKKSATLWILAIVITLASVVYQRLTGPTHPIMGEVTIAGETIGYKLLRTHETTADAVMTIDITNEDISGFMEYRRYKSHDTLSRVALPRDRTQLRVIIPKQPSAGKVIYQVFLQALDNQIYPLTETPIIIRFKDPVPLVIIVPHVILMFGAMLFATRTGFEALCRRDRTYRLTVWTTVIMFVGGLIFGPIVQKYAFGEFWTGWPWGHDLTDTKTALALVFWILALWRARPRDGQPFLYGRWWIVLASAVTFVIYLIPHSAWGSELDYTKLPPQ